MSDQEQYELKYIVIGCSGVGKSSILKRLVDHKFSEKIPTTIGIEFSRWDYKVDQHDIIFNIWDTAGQEKFYSIARSYFRNAIGIILVFDVTDQGSFDKLPKWLSDARAEADPNAVVMLVGNKLDQASKRVVSREDAETYAENNNLIYIESSAAEKQNIEQIFIKSAKEIVARIQSGEISYNDIKAKTVPKLNFQDEEEQEAEKDNSCC